MAFDQNIADLVCGHLADGKSMRDIEKIEGFPTRITIYNWRLANDDFNQACARAHLIHAEDEFDSLRDIEQQVLDEDLEPRAASCVIGSRQWRLDKLNRNKYGQKATNEHTGPNGGPIQTDNKWSVEFVNPTDKESKDDDH